MSSDSFWENIYKGDERTKEETQEDGPTALEVIGAFVFHTLCKILFP